VEPLDRVATLHREGEAEQKRLVPKIAADGAAALPVLVEALETSLTGRSVRLPWATDLWVSASENAQRIREADLEDRVFPIHADACSLPFADEFFDAIASIDAFEYFGTDDLYLPLLVRLLKPGCQIGAVNAGVRQEVESLPEEWPPDFSAFHTPEWWRRHWSMPRCVNVEAADHLPKGRDLWLRWHQAIGFTEDGWLTSPAGENLGFHRIVARRAR
jgi:SAM-dependent methyltransferase